MQKKLWIIFTAVGCVVILAAGWFLLVSPQRDKVASLNSDAENQQSVNADLNSKLSALRAGAAQVPAQQAQIDKIKQQIPATAQLPMLVRTVSKAANDAGVLLGTFTPASPTDAAGAAGVSYIALNADVKGGYFALQQFLTNLEKMQRALLVNGIAISSQTASSGSSSGASATPSPSASGSSGASIAGATDATDCPNLGRGDPCLQMTLQARVFSGSVGGAANTASPQSTSSPAAPSGAETPSSTSTGTPN